MPRAISSSVTSTTSSTYSSMIGRVISPGRLTAMPSAMVGRAFDCDGFSCFQAICLTGATISACTPTTRTFGKRFLTAMRDARNDSAAADRHDDDSRFGQILDDFPADSSLSGDNLFIVKSVNVGVAVFFLQFFANRRRLRQSSRRCRTTSAPCALVAIIFVSGANSGKTIVALMSCRRAASATPCA